MAFYNENKYGSAQELRSTLESLKSLVGFNLVWWVLVWLGWYGLNWLSLVWSICFDWVLIENGLVWLFRFGLSKFGLLELCLVWFWLDLVGLVLFRICLVSLVQNFTNRRKQVLTVQIFHFKFGIQDVFLPHFWKS